MGFGNLGKRDKIKAAKDVIYTGGNGVQESGILSGKIEVAFLGKSKGGAASLTVHVKKDGGGVFKTTMWLTGGDKKGNNNFYVDGEGNEQYLPGFIVGDHICLLAAGESLGDLAEDTVVKAVKLYDFDLKKEVNKEVETIEELEGQEIKLGVLKYIVDKTVQEGKVYVPTGETRETNEVAYVFSYDDGKTVVECIAEQEEAVFITEWETAFTGKTINKAKGAKAGGGNATAKGTEAGKKKASGIFGKKK